MPKKQQAMTNKLGSWTDQAQLTRNQPTPQAAPSSAPFNKRETYSVQRSLIDRIATTATQHGLSQNELVGHLLTWALDQVDAGVHQIPK
ncbi:MAG: hypothetical protein U0350_47510 [Caldilineaceae bacterium]